MNSLALTILAIGLICQFAIVASVAWIAKRHYERRPFVAHETRHRVEPPQPLPTIDPTLLERRL